MKQSNKTAVFIAGTLVAATINFAEAAIVEPIIIGLDADMSSGSARSGEAIRRGIELAMEEINLDGGVLKRPLQLVVKDHQGNPARGVDNIAAFANTDNLVAVVGGLHTPVAMRELDEIHTRKIIYLDPWAAGTPVVENGYDPNYVFRVSVRDEYAGGFLVRQAIARGYRKIGLALEKTGWGKSNEKGMTAALEKQGIAPVAVRWFHWGTSDMPNVIDVLADAGADVVLLVANSPEGKEMVRAMAKRPADERLPIISHWGITGGDFHANVGDMLDKVDLMFLQTYSFLRPRFKDRARRVIDTYLARYPETGNVRGIFAPVGTAHAYDLIYLLKQATEKAGTIERSKVRDMMERLDRYEGLVRDYAPPFTTKKHDALDADDFILARYAKDGAIVPVSSP